ncbi:stress-activated map kinase interacting protein 1-domain-containing protein [Cunninghamella echinulata]|nr:stress-activated map kinase interacting protein 1-domain-containing protein [Cunninghamella echinulata]
MALTTDADYLIHLMRVKFLRMDDRGERIMAFPPSVMSDDYVRLAAPRYPEMQYCYSPSYDLNTKENPIFGTGLVSSPRTKRTQYRQRKNNMNNNNNNNNNTMNNNEENNNNNINTSQNNETKFMNTNAKSSPLMNSRLESTSDSDEDFIFTTKKTQQQHHYNHQQQHPQSSQSQPQRSLDNSLKSNNKQVEDSSQLFSQGGASEITTLTTSLHPSMDSNIDPSPRSSLDAIDSTAQDLSLPYMNAPTTTTTAPRTSIEMNHHRYTKSSSSSSSPSNTLFHTNNNNNNNNNNTGLPLYSRYRKQSNVSMIPSNINIESFQNTSSLPLPPPPSSQQQQQKRLQIIPGKSLLTAMIAAKATTAENPFSTYSHASGKGSNRPLTLRIYLPHTDTPKEPITLIVRPDVIIDDVIGYILYDYIEQKRQPELEDEVYDLAQWSLLIVEDDGEVDDELPAMDRTRRIDKVGFDEFALCRATSSQAKQNEQVRAKLGRFGPDMESLKKKPSIPTAINMNGPTSSKMDNNNNINNNNNNNINQVNNNNNNNTLLQPSSSKKMSGSTNYSTSGNGDNNNILESSAQSGSQLQLDMEMMAASTMNTNLNIPITTSTTDAVADSSSIAVPVPSSKSVLTKAALPITPIKYFRIRLMTNDEVAATTTIPVYAEMFIGDVLELVSRKRKLDPNDYILTMSDSNLVVRNDIAVEDLKDVDELALRKKGSTLSIPTSSNHIWRSPIKKKKEESHQPMYFTTNDHNNQPSDNFLQQYKKYNINRKTPMFVGKKISILAIDGNYIHLMPPEHKGGMFDSLKTTSFHVGAIKFCKQSKKVPSNFKIGVMKERDFKTYELEAETSKEAYEICARIKFLIQMNKGSGT